MNNEEIQNLNSEEQEVNPEVELAKAGDSLLKEKLLKLFTNRISL